MFARALLLLAVWIGVASFADVAAAENGLTIGTWTDYRRPVRSQSLYQPTARDLGTSITEVPNDFNYLRIMVRAGNTSWDLVELSAIECVMAAREGLLEDIDYSTVRTEGLDPGVVRPQWVGVAYRATVLAWNPAKLSGPAPGGWRDLWDARAYPGKRTLGYSMPPVTLTIAALADGVAPENLYPFDLDRAFASIERIRPEIGGWWTSASLAKIYFQGDEAAMGSLPFSATLNAPGQQGGGFEFSFGQSIVDADCIAVPKGAPHRELAMRAVDMFLTPGRQAALALAGPDGPVNPAAFRDGLIPEDRARAMANSPANAAGRVLLDFEFWGSEQGDAAYSRFYSTVTR